MTDEERAAFNQLSTDAEYEQFVQQFWLRRDPTPGTIENEFKEEHYRRIAYANEHFSGGVPGWKTDRGRTYIMYGPRDEIDAHPYGGVMIDPTPKVAARYDLPISGLALSFYRRYRNRRKDRICRHSRNGRIPDDASPQRKEAILNPSRK